MSTQNSTLDADARGDTLLDTSLFVDETFQSYLNSNIDTIVNNSLVLNDPSSSQDRLYGYDLLNFDQGNNNTPFLNPCGLQADAIDPNLVLAQFGTFSGAGLVPSELQSVSVEQNNLAHGTSAVETAATAETQPPTEPKKRRTRKKKAPLPPAAKAEKRRLFLEKNRIAAGKCREKNRRKWDRLQEQCINLEAQNKVLKELRSEMKNEVESMMKYLREHEECGDKEIGEWIERNRGKEIGGEIGVEGRSRDSPIGDLEEGWRGSERSSQGDDETQGQNPTNEMDIDLTSFLEDEVPDLSPSRKSSTSTESDFDLDLTQADRQIPSRNDSGVDMSSDFDIRYGKAGKQEEKGVKIEGRDEELGPDTTPPSMCYFTGQHEAMRTGGVLR